MIKPNFLKGRKSADLAPIITFIFPFDKPLHITFFFLGAAAGMLNVIRTAKRMQKEN